jgi:catechol 2,3-dioxygenase-like lactoylglutathione lyase family enzyme
MSERIDIISVPVSNQAAAKAFYMDVLGFTLVNDSPMGPDQRWVQLRPAGGGTSITLVTWYETMPAGSLQGVVLETDDIASTCARLAARGLKLSPVAKEAWGDFTTFSDPDGNGWVLVQPPRPG